VNERSLSIAHLFYAMMINEFQMNGCTNCF